MADNISNSPPLPAHLSHVSCVYALSGTYGLLPRILYYTTLVFAVFGRTKEWLVIGALVSALTYAGTAAIHAMALCASKQPIFDLDIYGTWAILSTGALAYVAMVHWSSTLRNSRARIVVVTWGVLVGISLLFGRVMLFDEQITPPELPCYSSTGRLLQYPIELLSPEFNCTYKCFAKHFNEPMRQSSEIMAVPFSVVMNKYSRLGAVTVGPIMFAAYASFTLGTGGHTPSQVCMRVVMKYIDPKHNHEEIHRLIYNASMEQWYGGYFVLLSWFRRLKWSMMKLLVACFTIPWFALEFLIDVFCLPLLVTTVVLNEMMILGSHLPTNENNYAIGQWGPVVGSMLVVIASLINKFLEEWDERKKRSDIPKDDEGDDATKSSGSPDIELGCVDMDGGTEQQSGVVVPKLAHVQTLRDMDEWWGKPMR